jgi:CspA family cold shock protein
VRRGISPARIGPAASVAGKVRTRSGVARNGLVFSSETAYVGRAKLLLSTCCLLLGFSCDSDDTEPGHRTTRMANIKGDITMANGTVKWFNATKGFGFIAPAQGSKDVFVHISALERAGIRQLNDGQAVTYDLENDRNGRESAVNIALA